MRTKLIVILLFFAFSHAWSQQTTAFTEANRTFKQGIDLFDKGVYGAAQVAFQQTLDLLIPLNEAEFENMKNQAQLYLARCAVRQNLPDGEKIMLDFIRSIAPDPASNEALVELANYYFNAKEYDKAINLLRSSSRECLTPETKAAVLFKQGYAYFTKQQFGKAKTSFTVIKNIQGEYYYPTHYYLGLVHFFDGSYGESLQSFQIVDRSTIKKYKSVLPYYIAQIYFVEGRYDELLSYAIPKLNEGGLSNVKEIYQLVGQTYFERQQYTNALPYFEYYAERSTKMREEEFYQLGFVYMESRQPNQAIKYFKELNSVDSELGQNAAYNLGRMYVEIGDKNSAKAAFARASRMAFNADVQAESLFNYAKLSYELKQDQDALLALQSITPTSKYYRDAQSLMAQILLDTRDYERALATLKGLPNLTPELREVLQKVNYYRGVQLLQTGKMNEAKPFFNASLENPVNKEIQALAFYWLGDIAYRAKDYPASSRQINQFLTMARGLQNLPDESSLATANYIQGYNYLKQQNFTGALSHFQSAIKDLNNNLLVKNKQLRNQLLGDATLRAGDCHFKRNQYNDAIKFYDEAINKKYSDFVYALYQKAIIEGLRGNITEKILSLERIVDQYNRSPYADDALLQLGITYQEVGKLELASGQLERLVRDFKNKSELVNQALIQLGLVNYNRGRKEEALNYYKQVFGNNPEPSEAQAALRALEEIYVNDLGNADAYFAFLKTIPGYDIDVTGRDSINFRAAEAQFENGNYRKAIENYSNYIAKFPKGQSVILAYYRRGDSNSALKLYSEALADYEYVVGRGQSKYFTKALEKAAIIAYNHEQNFKRSYELYAKLEEVAENNDIRLEAQLGALRSAYRANLTNEVFELSKRVAENSLASQDQVASANFYYGKISYDRKDYDNALRAFEQVTKLSDNEQTAEARYMIAYIYYIRRDLEKAQEITLNSNRESSSYPYWVAKSVILLSDILTEKGDLFNARAALEALLDNYSADADLVQTAKDKLAQVNRRINAGSRIDNASPNNFIDDGTGNN
ncbi:MAG: tetratricopeptide repeat protein [Saprospiraceae bacterium]|nr:tetratricopeptide repeat protein [Saprospiraceae bacterium]